ncbi:MAG: hypothetical protein ACLTYW_06960 [Collinsella sp.]
MLFDGHVLHPCAVRELFLSGEKLTRYNLGAALLCLAGIGLVALDSVEFNIGDVITLAVRSSSPSRWR